MTRQLQTTSPQAFGLDRFRDLLPPRDPLLGEEPASFEGFHEGLMVSLAPATPYEVLIAENLVAIEWELLQHRRMRDASLRKNLRARIVKAVTDRNEGKPVTAPDIFGDFQEFPILYPSDDKAQEIAMHATSHDPGLQSETIKNLKDLDLDPVALLAEAYRRDGSSISIHEEKLQDLERRRREVRRDYEALQKVRPIEAEATDAEVF